MKHVLVSNIIYYNYYVRCTLVNIPSTICHINLRQILYYREFTFSILTTLSIEY